MGRADIGTRLEDVDSFESVGEVRYMYASDDARPLFWHESAQNAFYISIDALNAFQRVDSLGGNPYVIPSIGMWFLSVESYISTLYKIACRDSELIPSCTSLANPPRSPRATRKLVGKLQAVEDYFSEGRIGNRELALRLGEFATFRNQLFHDLTSVSRPQFMRTAFPQQVENANEVHAVHAAVLAVEAFVYFRHLFPGADLMPSVRIGLAHEKLDVLVDEVLLPAFSRILQAKGLTTAVPLERQVSTFGARAGKPLRMVIRAEGVMSPIPTADIQLICRELMDKAIASRPTNPDKFTIPDYTAPSGCL